jgi:O-antigen/teichoic acid export membrane protein
MILRLFLSYLSNFYAAIAGLLCVPIYYKLLGPLDFGFVSYFLLFFPLLPFLDLGIGSTLMRQTSLYRSNALTVKTFGELLVGVQIAAYSIALSAFAATILYCFVVMPAIKPVEPGVAGANSSVFLLLIIGFILKWLGNLYRSCISGLEKLEWLSWFNIGSTTLRYFFVLLVMEFFGFSAFIFLLGQAVISLAELSILIFKLRGSIPLYFAGTQLSKAYAQVRGVLRFSSTLGIGGAVWVLAAQTDKVYLAHKLNLVDYGHFSMAVLLAGGVSMISSPINYVLLPRLSMLHAAQDMPNYIATYRKMTQIVTIIAGSAACVLWFFAEDVLWVWTGKQNLLADYALTLGLYSIGNFFLALSIFGHYAQISIGNLRYYMSAVVFFGCGLLALLAIFTTNNLATGAGLAWVTINAVYLFGWTSFLHMKLLPQLAVKWVVFDILQIFSVTLIANALMHAVFTEATSRLEAFWQLCLVSAVSLLIAVVMADLMRGMIMSFILERRLLR